jgi:hypothetical protein
MGNVLLFRFDEVDDIVRPADSLGNLDDLTTEAGLAAPLVVDAALGRGRRFDPPSLNGYRAQDVVSGSTLLTRDCSIQVVLNWQLAGQNSYGFPGTIYARGKGTSAAEYMGAGLELRVVNAALSVGELRWLWHDTAGVLKTQIGGHFQPHASESEFLLLTATRRWVSSTEVILRYYIGDVMLTEIPSVDGSIGGGTTGTTSIGARFTGAAWDRFLDGTIDELRVVDYELCAEEIAATYRRITYHQPRGYDLVKSLHDPGFPISGDPGSRVQRETRMWGNALGFASAQAENVRNFVPQRAYGTVLEDWETVTKQAPKPGDSVDTRRARVVARQRRGESGVSIDGVEAALRELVDTDPTNLEIIAFDQTVREGFAALSTLRWTSEPAADWTISGNALRAQAAAGDFQLTGALRNWKTNMMSIGGDGRGANHLAKLTPTTIPTAGEVGIFLANFATGDLILLGLKHAGNYFVTCETFRAWASQGAAFAPVDLGAGLPANLWLHLRHAGAGSADIENMLAAWSTTSGTAGFTTSAAIAHKWRAQWAGHYVRSVGGAIASALDSKFDDSDTRAPFGERSFFFYVYRDPALPGRPDLVGANHIIRQLKQAHTHVAVITNKSTLCDDVTTPCDLGPLGGI